MTAVVVVNFVTKQSTEFPLLLSTQLSCEVDSEQVVEDITLNTIVLNLTLCVIGRTNLSSCHVVSRIDIQTSLLTESQLEIVNTQFRRILEVCVTEHTVGVLTELIVV